MHKTLTEGKVILDQVLENTSFMDQYNEPLPEASVSRIEEPPIPESELEASTSPDSTEEPLPEPSLVEAEEIQAPGRALPDSTGMILMKIMETP